MDVYASLILCLMDSQSAFRVNDFSIICLITVRNIPGAPDQADTGKKENQTQNSVCHLRPDTVVGGGIALYEIVCC